MLPNLLSFYGLTHDPFGPPSDATDILAVASQSHLVSQILADVSAEPGVVTVRGHKGIGKTSVSRLVGLALRQHGAVAVEVASGRHNAIQIQAMIGQAAGVGGSDRLTPDQLARELPDRLGRRGLVLVVDDAERLTDIEYRYLVLLRAALSFTRVGFGLILIGAAGPWPAQETADLPGLRPEGVARHMIFPLHEDEAVELLRHKVRQAGRPVARVLSAMAVLALVREADYVPGQIEALTASALAAAFAQRRRRVTLRTVWPLLSPGSGLPAQIMLRSLRAPALVAACLLLGAMATGGYLWRDELGLDRARTRLAGLYTDVSRLLDPSQPDTGPPEILVPAAPPRAPAQAEPLPPPSALVKRSPVSPPVSTVPPDTALALARPSPPAEPLHQAPPEARPAIVATPLPAPLPPDPAAIPPEPPTLLASQPSSARQAVELSAPKPVREPSRGSPGLILVAGADDTLPALYARVYRGVTPPPYADVLAMNHSPIRAGELLVFPEPPNGWSKR